MGIFKAIFGRPAPKRPLPDHKALQSSRVITPKAVQVHFRDIRPIDHSRLSPRGTYTYAWTFPSAPNVGMWVMVEGMDGPTTARIYKIGRSQNSLGMELKPVLSVVPEKQVQAALAKYAKTYSSRYGQARKTVTLPYGGEIGISAPHKYSEMPPLKAEKYTAEEADRYGRTWWRIYKQAEEQSRPSDEVSQYKSAAYAWFQRRDRLLDS